MDSKREALAAYAHEAWSGWMRYMIYKCSIINVDGSVTIPANSTHRWLRQMDTSYAALPESEKASDRAEADKILAIVEAS